MCPAGRSRGAKHSPRETGIRVSAPFPGGGGTHPLGLEFKQSSLARAWPNSRTPLDPLTLGLTSLHPHAVVPSLLSDEGKRIVLPAFFQRGRDFPDKTRQTLATAHAPARHAEAHSGAEQGKPRLGGPGDANYRTLWTKHAGTAVIATCEPSLPAFGCSGRCEPTTAGRGTIDARGRGISTHCRGSIPAISATRL